MFKLIKNACVHKSRSTKTSYARFFRTHSATSSKLDEDKRNIEIPHQADVVVVGGGSAGCHALYHLTKRGIKAVLLERHQLTSGTTWHTAGLIWRLRPNDVEIQILANSRNLFKKLEEETSLDPGWIQNGGIFIAHSEVRLDEYKRLSTIGNISNIENQILSASETKKIFPLLNEKSFIASLYSPGDGVVDPAMLCAALKKASTNNGGTVIENCPVEDLLVSTDEYNAKKVIGIKTPYGNIKSDTIINATGVWGRDLAKKYGSLLPIIPIKHSYIVTENINGIRGMPNVRDHDYSIYFRIQGDSICMGGYEPNPILLDEIPSNFKFGLYDLDWSVFDTHITKAISLCDSFNNCGIKSTICGPESFTPDHKPLMGPDINIKGLYHSCGYNSAGMMFGGGCGEQIALWAINGEPDLPMFQFDVRRFSNNQISNKRWIRERSHESYVKNYSIVFPYDQPLGGRNVSLDPLHNQMIENNAFMEEKQGWERPGFFMPHRVSIESYDWYGSYDFKRNENSPYENCLNKDLQYDFSGHHEMIKNEALSCRNNAVVFNMSYFGKMYLDGPDSEEAAKWLFSSNVLQKCNKVIYTCALNNLGGVEADVTLFRTENPKTKESSFYIVSGGASSNYTYYNLRSELMKKGFRANLKDVTADYGIISIQGPNSRHIVQNILDIDLSDNEFPQNTASNGNILLKNNQKINVKVLRVSFVGELGYELHVKKENCAVIYKHLMDVGKSIDLKNAGYRALYALSHEKGYHLWGFDLRSYDTPLEAGLSFTCRKQGEYRGKKAIEKQRSNGVQKKLVFLTIDDQIPLWGLEGVYRNGEPVGFIRRAEYAFTLGKPMGKAYIECNNGQTISDEFIKSGKFEIDIMGKRYKADCHLKSPFDKILKSTNIK